MDGLSGAELQVHKAYEAWIDSLKAQLAAKDAQLEKLKTLALRWNRAASGVGICGSEYVDDPERVFDAVRCTREALHKAAIRRQADPGVAAKDAVIEAALSTLRNIAIVARGYRPRDEVCDLIARTADAEVAALALAAPKEEQ